MKKQIISIVLVMALAIGVTTFASAAPVTGETSGSIDFRGADAIIINPPSSGSGENGGGTGIPGYGDFFTKLGAKNDLYFGEHEVFHFGLWSSKDYEGGKYTGVEIINGTANKATIGVQISAFTLNGEETLKGSTVALKFEKSMANGAQEGFAYQEPTLTGSTSEILTVNSGREVKVAWYGTIDVLQGTAAAGKAQANLTWTEMNVA